MFVDIKPALQQTKNIISHLEKRYIKASLIDKSKINILLSTFKDWYQVDVGVAEYFDDEDLLNSIASFTPQQSVKDSKLKEKEGIYPIRIARTNHPTYPLGHDAGVEFAGIQDGYTDYDFDKVNKHIESFLSIEKIATKRKTEESSFSINNHTRIAWEAHDIIDEETRNSYVDGTWDLDSDGNPGKTIEALKEVLVDKNAFFQKLVVSDLDDKISSKFSSNPRFKDLVDYIKNFEISESNILYSEHINEKITEFAGQNKLSKAQENILNNFKEKIAHFGTITTKDPHIRQEGNIYQKGYNILIDRLSEAGVGSVEDVKGKFGLNKNGDVVVDHDGQEKVLIANSEFAQDLDAEGFRKPLPKNGIEVQKDNVAKLIYLANLEENFVQTYIMSEFGDLKEMADTLRMMDMVGIDTKGIDIFPLVEEIENYSMVDDIGDILKRAKQDVNTLRSDEKVIFDFIKESGTISLMHAASDNSKRAGTFAYTKILGKEKELIQHIADYNEGLPEKDQLTHTMFWGGSCDKGRGGGIDFMEAGKSFAGDRGVKIQFVFTEQGQSVARESTESRYLANREAIVEANNKPYLKPESEREKLAERNVEKWKGFSELFAVLGDDMKNLKSTSSYTAFSNKWVHNRNPLLGVSHDIAAATNTSDRPSKKTLDTGKRPILEFSRAIGYDHGAKFIGANHTIMGHHDKLREFFDKIKSGDDVNISIESIQKEYKDSTAWKTQIDNCAKLLGESTDMEHLSKMTDLVQKYPEKFGDDAKEYLDDVKKNTTEVAKFIAIAQGKADVHTDPMEAYNTIKSENLGRMQMDTVKNAQAEMLGLFELIGKGEVKSKELGAYAAVGASFIHSHDPEHNLEAKLKKRVETKAKILIIKKVN